MTRGLIIANYREVDVATPKQAKFSWGAAMTLAQREHDMNARHASVESSRSTDS
jgi:hypothetical protein